MLIRLLDSNRFLESLKDIHKKLGVPADQTAMSISPDGKLELLRKNPTSSLGLDNKPLAGYSWQDDTWVVRVS